TRADVEQLSDGGIPGVCSAFRRPGRQRDTFGPRVVTERLQARQVGIERSDAQRQRTGPEQRGKRLTGRFGAQPRLDLVALERAGAERSATPNEHVLVAVGNVAAGKTGAV